MNCYWRTFVVVLLIDGFKIFSASLVPASTTTTVNAQVELQFNETCSSGVIEWKHKQKTASGKFSHARLFARLDQATGPLKPAPGSKGRVKHVNKTSYLIITSVVFNDNGWFEMYCNGKHLEDLELKVLVPNEISAHAGDDRVLPCHGLTDSVIKDTEIYLRWTKNGQTILIVTKGNVTYGPEFQGKVPVSKKAYDHGDLSLTLTNVQSSDQGIYQCFYGLGNHQGNPEAISLTVNPKVQEKQKPGTCILWKMVVTVLVIVLVGFSIFCLKKYNWRPECFKTIGSVFPRDCCLPAVSHPVQESPAEVVFEPHDNNEYEESRFILRSECESDVKADKTRNGSCVPFAPAQIISLPVGQLSVPSLVHRRQDGFTPSPLSSDTDSPPSAQGLHC